MIRFPKICPAIWFVFLASTFCSTYEPALGIDEDESVETIEIDLSDAKIRNAVRAPTTIFHGPGRKSWTCVLRNSGTENTRVRLHPLGCGCIKAHLSKDQLGPGQIATLEIQNPISRTNFGDESQLNIKVSLIDMNDIEQEFSIELPYQVRPCIFIDPRSTTYRLRPGLSYPVTIGTVNILNYGHRQWRRVKSSITASALTFSDCERLDAIQFKGSEALEAWQMHVDVKSICCDLESEFTVEIEDDQGKIQVTSFPITVIAEKEFVFCPGNRSFELVEGKCSFVIFVEKQSSRAVPKLLWEPKVEKGVRFDQFDVETKKSSIVNESLLSKWMLNWEGVSTVTC